MADEDDKPPDVAANRGRPPNLVPPWKKGQSGNPAGVSKSYAEIRMICQERGRIMVDRLTQIALEKNGNKQAAIQAARTILAYGYGMPNQAVTLSGADGGPVRAQLEFVAAQLTTDEMRRRRADLRAIEDAQTKPPMLLTVVPEPDADTG